MRTIYYIQKIHTRGWFGIPCTRFKVRTAHVDAQNWKKLRGQPFSLTALMLCPGAPEPEEAARPAPRLPHPRLAEGGMAS